MKKYIGIFPTIKEKNSCPFDNKHEFTNKIIECITKEDAIPILLTLKDEKINPDLLKLCDACIIPGGSVISPFIYESLKYAYENKKPVLGICLGMQILAIFSSLLKEKTWNEKIFKEKEQEILRKLPDDSHHKVSLTMDNLEQSSHYVFIEPTSKLYEYYQQQLIKVYSFHLFSVEHIDKFLKVTSFSEDGVLESIETNNQDWLAIGVQFHPEYDKENTLIKKFILDIL